MSASNVMEVITKGSFDVTEGIDSRCSTSQSARAESQLSLEYLPPEAPYYGSNSTYNLPMSSLPDDADTSSPGEKDRTTTKLDSNNQSLVQSRPGPSDMTSGGVSAHELFDQIQQLSEKIHSQLGTLDDVESLNSHRSTPLNRETQSRQHTDYNRTESVHSSIEGDQLSTDVSGRGSEPCCSGRASGIDALGSGENTLPSHGSGDNSEQTQDAQCGRDDLNSSDIGVDGVQQDTEEDLRSARDASVTFGQDDNKMQKAIKKMKKLDEKLDSLVKKEREVKRQRKLLEQQMEGSTSERSSNALVLIEDDISLPTSPLFPTQPHEVPTCKDGGSTHHPVVSVNHHSESTDEVEDTTMEDDCSNKQGETASQSSTVVGTDFIKRNIELAADAGALVAMTETEKNRLEQLLSDDAEMEDPYTEHPLSITDGGGFTYSDHDLERMRNIDSQLQMILPAKDWESVCSSSRNTTPAVTNQPKDELTTKSSFHEHESCSELSQHETDLCSHDAESFNSTQSPDISINTAKHVVVPGEEVLHQFQMTREEKDRLRDIDARLKVIQAENERILDALVPLPAPHLQMLLEQYSKEHAGGVCRDPLDDGSVPIRVDDRTECGVDVVDGVV